MRMAITCPIVLVGLLCTGFLAISPAMAIARNGAGQNQPWGNEPWNRRHALYGVNREVASDGGAQNSSRELFKSRGNHQHDHYPQSFAEGQKRFSEQRERGSDRWQRFRDLPPDRQDQLRRKYQRWKELPPDEQERLKRTWRRYRELPPQRQQQLKDDLRSLRDLPEAERERQRQELHKRYFPDLPPPPPRKQ